MRRLLALLSLFALVAAACGDDDGGGEAADTTTTAVEAEMTVTSDLFAEGGEIPLEAAGSLDPCDDGGDVSPPLAWENLPDDTAEIAVVMTDPDADGFIHWVVSGIDPTATGLEAGTVPDGAVEAVNDIGTAAYFGPCPPETHTYVFTVHALAEPSGLASGPGADAIATIESLSLASAELTGTYTPQG